MGTHGFVFITSYLIEAFVKLYLIEFVMKVVEQDRFVPIFMYASCLGRIIKESADNI